MGTVHAHEAETDEAAPRAAVRRLPGARRTDEIYAALRRAIVLGELAAGTALAELQLGLRFGCSQGSVREALFRLQEDGLVRREGYRGTTVSATSAEEVVELVALRLRLEPTGVRAGLARMSEATLRELAERVTRMEEMARAGDIYGITEADRAFHLTIFGSAGLRALEPILDRCFLLLHRFALTDPHRRRTALETARRHWAIVDALTTRDPVLAGRALRQHIETVVEGLPELRGALAA